MARPLVTIALTGFAVSVVSFIGAGVILASTAASALPFSDIFRWGRCENELGAAGEETATREFEWAGHNAINLQIASEVRYRPGARNTLQARGPAYLLEHLEIDGGSIRLNCNTDNLRSVQIDLEAGNITEFSVQGSGDMLLENLDEREVDGVTRVSVQGSGDLVLTDLSENEVELSIAGSGSVRAAGNVDRVSLTIAGSGDADLGDLLAGEMRVSIAGSGDAIVSPLDSIAISIAGSGDVQILTDPGDVDTSITGSGRVSGPANN